MSQESGVEPGAEQCWQEIGVWGDGSCTTLDIHIHCRNCPVYQSAGRRLLDREAGQGYIQSLTEQFGHAQQAEREAYVTNEESTLLLIFRLRNEWLAIASQFFREAAPPSKVHRIPHRSNEILRGLLNIRGEMMLCVSLSHLLELEGPTEAGSQMLVMEMDQSTWVFEIDELEGLQAISNQLLLSPPSTVTRGSSTYTQSVFRWKDRQVNLLDGELLFYAIQRRAMPA